MMKRAIDNVDEQGRKYLKRPSPIGFQNQLIEHDQLGDVYHHIEFVAGTVLFGGLTGEIIRTEFMWKDLMQIVIDERKESLAELEDDFAGVQVGKAMDKAFKDRNFEALKKSIRDTLCK